MQQLAIDDLKSQWNLSLLTPVPNMTFNFVAFAEMGADRDKVVLKISPSDRSIWNEVRWLKHYQTLTPTLLKFDELANAFLMKRCQNGRSLKDDGHTLGDEATTRILCGAIRSLREMSVRDDSYRHLSDLTSDFDALETFTDKRSFAKAQDLFRDLTQDCSQDILLHGDLHHDNLLRNGDNWLVIDPHGYQGHPTAETGTMIYNPLNELPTDRPLAETLDRRIHILGEELGDDLKLVQAWCYCKTMLSAAWNVESFPKQARHELGIAQVIEGLKF